MPSYTASLRLIQPATGEYSGTWGTQVNTGITALVDASIAGTTSITMTAANYTLTTANGASDESRAMFLVLGGTPGAAREVIVPAVSKLYFVTNNTTGGFAQTVKTASGSGISVPNGARMTLRCDGTDVVVAQNYFASLTLGAALPVASGGTGATTSTGSGAVVLATSPTLTDPVVTSLNTGQLAGMRNKIINGKMEVAQRGTSFAGLTGINAYTLDRFEFATVGASVSTVTQQADAPISNEFQNSLRIAVTTADTSIAAGDIGAVRQRIEGFNARDLIGRTFTLSFWVRSSKTGIHCASFSNSGLDRSYVVEYTVNAANTWELKTITITGGLITAGTWNWTSGTGLDVRWALAAGSTWQTTAGAWQTGNLFATSNQVNCLDSNTNIFAITGVQLEVGSVATPFEHRPIGAELALCQRYFQVFNVDDLRVSGYGATSSASLFTTVLPVVMRATPSTIVQPGSWNNTNVTGTTLTAGSQSSVRVSGTVTTLGTFSWQNTGTLASVSSEL